MVVTYLLLMSTIGNEIYYTSEPGGSGYLPSSTKIGMCLHDSLWAMAKLFVRSLSQLWFVVTSYILPEWGMALSHFKVWGYLEGGDAGDEEVIYVR